MRTGSTEFNPDNDSATLCGTSSGLQCSDLFINKAIETFIIAEEETTCPTNRPSTDQSTIKWLKIHNKIKNDWWHTTTKFNISNIFDIVDTPAAFFPLSTYKNSISFLKDINTYLNIATVSHCVQKPRVAPRQLWMKAKYKESILACHPTLGFWRQIMFFFWWFFREGRWFYKLILWRFIHSSRIMWFPAGVKI